MQKESMIPATSTPATQPVPAPPRHELIDRLYGAPRRTHRATLVAAVAIAAMMGLPHLADAKTTITYFMATGQEDWAAWTRETARLFEKEHPAIQVDILLGDMNKLLTMVTGGVYPDVIHIDGGSLPLYAETGLLKPLDPLIKGDTSFDLSAYIPSLIQTAKWKGTQYALPRAWGAVALVYNRDLLDGAGVAYPGESWTWTTLLDAARKMTRDTNGDGHADQFGFYDTWANVNRFPIWIWQAGGDIWNSDFTKPLIDQAASIAGLRFYHELYFRHHAGPRVVAGQPFNEPGLTTTNQDQLFRSGKVAMVHATRYFTPDEVSWNVAPLAKGPANRQTMLIPSVAGIYANSPHPREAWEFLKFFASAEGFLAGDNLKPMRPVYQGAIPPTLALAQEWLSRRKDVQDIMWIVAAREGRLNNVDNPFANFSGRSDLGQLLNRVARGEESLETGLRELSARWAAQLANAAKK